MLCPCNSQKTYTDCCGPFLAGTPAPTAVALMRSRYAAFAMGDVAYLDQTQHPDHVDQALPEDERRRAIAAFARSARFPGLKIVDDGADGEDALVLFIARVFVGRDDETFMECSRFKKHGNDWRYLAGDLEDDVAARQLKTIAAYQARPKTDEAATDG